MSAPLVLASTSSVRQQLMKNAGLTFEALPARIDEDLVKSSLVAEGAPPRDIADTLAEMKAQKVSNSRPEALVIGCDQIAVHNGRLLSKAASPEALLIDLQSMRGQTHKLISAAVIYQAGKPEWRYVGEVRLNMRAASDAFLWNYIERNWDDIRHCVGGYMLEAEGIRLFDRITGDYFHVLGIPLMEIVTYLAMRGEIEG